MQFLPLLLISTTLFMGKVTFSWFLYLLWWQTKKSQFLRHKLFHSSPQTPEKKNPEQNRPKLPRKRHKFLSWRKQQMMIVSCVILDTAGKVVWHHRSEPVSWWKHVISPPWFSTGVGLGLLCFLDAEGQFGAQRVSVSRWDDSTGSEKIRLTWLF